MKPNNRTYNPPRSTPAFDIYHDYARQKTEACAAIKDLYLALDEARAMDEHTVGYESNKLVLLWNSMTQTPADHLTILRMWNSFRMPLMVDGCSVSYERAVEAMNALLRS